MANPADEWSSADVKALAHGGLINEDVMNKIWDISRVPLPFTDMIGVDTVSNSYTSWAKDTLGTPSLTNAHVDGADITQNDASGAERVGNECQISVKRVSVTERVQGSNTIGGNELSRQVMRRQQELRRDVEATALHNQASVADDGDTVAGKAGSFRAWLETNTDLGAGGADGGFSAGLVTVATNGTIRDGTETEIRALVGQAWEGGANLSIMMSVPSIIRALSQYLLTAAAGIATLTSDAGQSAEEMTAKGSVNVFLTDHGQVLTMRPNRVQQNVTTNNAPLYFIDPSMVSMGYLNGYRVEPLAKTGLADKRLMAVDWTLKVYAEEAHAVLADLDTLTPSFSA